MKVWVIWDKLLERVLGVYSNQKNVEEACDRFIEQTTVDGPPDYYSNARFNYDEFELDKDEKIEYLLGEE